MIWSRNAATWHFTYLRYFCSPSSSVMISSFAYVLYGELNELLSDWFGLMFALNDVWKSCRFEFENCDWLKLCCWWWAGDRLNAEDHMGVVLEWPEMIWNVVRNNSTFIVRCDLLSANDECQLMIDVLAGGFVLLSADFFGSSGDLTTNDVSEK